MFTKIEAAAKNISGEFLKFAMRGNVMDMAVGVIIGAAFGKIVDSLVKDIIMPPLGWLLGRVDFSSLFFTLKQGSVQGPYATPALAQAAGAVTVNYGNFINTIVTFLITAFAIFVLIKAINNFRSKADPAPVTTKECPFCFSKINIKATKCPACTSEIK